MTSFPSKVAHASAPKARRHATPGLARTMALGAVALLLGCTDQRPPSHQNPESAKISYWVDQPASASARADDYAALWNAADEARRHYGFTAALSDYRGGLLTTEPKISPQFFEFWHQELRSAEAVAESSLATIRRRMRFEFSRAPGGGFIVEPKVIVERLSQPERRITSAIDYRGTLGPGRQQQFGPAMARGPAKRWYAIARDEDLERALAQRISAGTRNAQSSTTSMVRAESMMP